MANNKTGKPVRNAWVGVSAAIALGLMVFSGLVVHGQLPEEPSRPPRVRLLMNQALDLNKRGDYELAARIFAQVQASQNELSPTEQRDLKFFVQQNTIALTEQRDGTVQVHQAEEAVRLGRMEDAARLVRGLTANQYLSAADRQKLTRVNDSLRLAAAPVGDPGGKLDSKAMLAAAREAMKRNDLEAAEAYCAAAEKVARTEKSWLPNPFSDTASKVRRDIVAARAKLPPAALVRDNPNMKEAPGNGKNATSFFPPMDSPPLARDLLIPPPPLEAPSGAPPLPPGMAMVDLPPRPEDPGMPLPKGTEAVRQTTYPGTPSSAPPGPGASTKELAKKLTRDAYKAYQENDLESARRLALQAMELQADLDWWEGPGRLLDDIQRRMGAVPAPGAIAGNGPMSGMGDARNLVKEARVFLQHDNIEEADKLCVLAVSVQPKGWGLFEDSPDKLRADIQKARTKRDRDESARLLGEARKLYNLGNIQEAKQKAYSAQKLHGPYNIWDFGDRPQKLLEEIQRVESKNGFVDMAKGPGKTGSPLVSGTAQAAAKIRAVALLQEARDLQRKGLLVEARAKALEADQLRVSFGPDEDSPASVQVSLAAQCERTVDQLLQRATDQVQNHPTDPQRFDKAAADISAARQLVRAFQLDSGRIEQKAQWLQQAATSSGVQPIAGLWNPSVGAGLVQAGGTGAPLTPQAGRNRLLGLEKLDKARLELTAGNWALARRLAEEALSPQYGIQEEAGLVLRSVDADEHNHQVNLANRNADAGIAAYDRKEYRMAAGIFQGIDLKFVQPDKARRIGEIMTLREMQFGAVQLVDAKQPSPAAPAPKAGSATATDLAPGDDLGNFRAMEEIQFQQMRERGMAAQKTAMELFKAGRKAQAVDVLKDYLEELRSTNFDAPRLALLQRPVENRLNQYRTILAQESIELQVGSASSSKWDENKYQRNKLKVQEEVAEQIKLYRTLQKEGKYQEALAAARKAKELDPDNLAADAAIQITTIKLNQENYTKGVKNNEEMFLKALDPDNGVYVDTSEPLKYDGERFKRAQARENGNKGYWSPTRDPVERSIERRLSEPISLTFKDTPLGQVISDLQMLSGVNIVPDRAALQDANISLDTPLTLPVDKISLKSALNILLDQVKLTYVIKDQVLMITTKENAKGRLRMVTYSVADLVVPVDNHPVAGINDMNTALARTLAGAGTMMTSPPAPYTTTTSLPGGSPASSQSSGVGSTFAMTGGTSNSAPALVRPRAPGQTMEDLLINLIQNTVAQNSWKEVGGQGSIQYYPLGMALVVNQTQEVQEDVAALLASLRRLQDLEIAIEMRLVSVSESFFEYMGVDFNVNLKTPTSANEANLLTGNFTPFGSVNRNNSGLNTITGLTPAGTLTPDLNIPIQTSSFNFAQPPFGGFPGVPGSDGGISLGLAFLSDIQVFMFMEAAQGDRRENIMQAPKITVFNGQTANITVNDQQFFITNYTVNIANAQTFITPNNQPFPLGVTMQVTPVVSADRRFVRLNLAPNLTNLSATTVPLIPIQIPVPQVLEGPANGNTIVGQPSILQIFVQQPAFTTITLDTTVNVPDGGTVLLGGLKTMSEGRNEYGPPILGKIPYLNRLFTNVAYGRDGQSLMIMVTPRIIINEEEEQIFQGLLPPIPRP